MIDDIDAYLLSNGWEPLVAETWHVRIASRRLGVADLTGLTTYATSVALAAHAEQIYRLAEVYQTSWLRRTWARAYCWLTRR